MVYSLRYFDKVESDLHEAKTWYKAQKEGLELEFVDAIESAILLILRNPMAFSLRYKEIRIAHPKKFPFNIHYYIDEPKMEVVIIAIVHGKRNPSITWKRT